MTTPKSTLKRLATLDPNEMAERLYRAESALEEAQRETRLATVDRESLLRGVSLAKAWLAEEEALGDLPEPCRIARYGADKAREAFAVWAENDHVDEKP